MLEIVEYDYISLPTFLSEELFTLRRKTFKDRLKWSVNCINNMEYDEYDNEHTTYLLGSIAGCVICGVRLIDFKYSNMILGTFPNFFKELNIPSGRYIESSRIFVDKTRTRQLMRGQPPASLQLFLAMIRHSRKHNYEGIITLINYQMLKVLNISGWHSSIIQEGFSEVGEKVYIIILPINNDSEASISNKIKRFIE